MYENQEGSKIKSIFLLTNKYKYKQNECQTKGDPPGKPNSFFTSLTSEAIGPTPQRVRARLHKTAAIDAFYTINIYINEE
jgi:hypothetical protein